jgi:osmoprotectant transport system permease protein
MLGAIGILQTIPSLAMLAILLTLLQKIGTLPAMVALILYALLPIVRNTVTGLEGVSEDAVEAARGVGMTRFQQLRIVRLPLAMPVIVAGIRTAAVVGVGIATLAEFIGAGGLGQFINRGLALSNTRLILLGAIPAALLALVVDFSIAAVQWGMKSDRIRQKTWLKYLRPIAALQPFALLLLGILACVGNQITFSDNQGSVASAKPIIRVGSKNFTEQLIISEIMAQLIEDRTRLRVERLFDLGGTMINHEALIRGEIDLYPEYTGTALTAILKRKPMKDPSEVLQVVRGEYKKRFRLVWLEPFGFNNSYSLTVRYADARKYNWTRISDLTSLAHRLRAGWTAEFSERPDGYPGLQKAYGLHFAKVSDLDPAIMYQAISKKQVDVICAFTTDGRIPAYKLKPLIDDKQFFPPYYAAPVIREETLKKYPELRKTLLELGGRIHDSTMQGLNYQVDKEQQQVSEVARKFLISQRLVEKMH